MERQPFRPTETTADPLQLDSLASHMLGARTQGRHGRGEAEPRWAERSTKGGEDWDVLRDVGGKWRKGICSPFSSSSALYASLTAVIDKHTLLLCIMIGYIH